MKFSFLRSRALITLFLGAAITLAGCDRSHDASTIATPSTSPAALQFTDITSRAGIRFVHNNGAFGLKWMPETTGSGVAFIDYNGDGYQDIFLVNSRDWTDEEIDAYRKSKWSGKEADDYMKSQGLTQMVDARQPKPVPSRKPRSRTTSILYRNNKNGTFSDVTKGSGLDIEMYGMGAVVGDYDNDGWPDLYVTTVGRNYLFHNSGKGSFQEVAATAGVEDSGWSTSAAWLDFDKDGKLDLFVGHYVKWSPELNAYDAPKGKRIYSGPEQYDGQLSRLYHNKGGGKFEDVSARAGIQQFKEVMPNARDRDAMYQRAATSGAGAARNPYDKVKKPEAKVLGVALCDYNRDDWPDIVVANDKVRNYLFKNNKNGTFTEVGVVAGIAFGADGKPRAGMGIDAGDIDQSGRDAIVIGNFSNEMLGLYQNQGEGVFADIASRSDVAKASRDFLTFGLSLTDIDNDGLLDIFVANGHIDDTVKEITGDIEYAQRPLLFHNEGNAHFSEIGLQTGEAMKKPIVARGLAYADIDLDGDADVILTTSSGPAILLRNDGGNKNNVVRLILQGTKSNRSAIGAEVEAKIGDHTLRRMVRSGSSYLSQSELPVTLGLGGAKHVDSIVIKWPSGKATRLQKLPANTALTIDEDKGVLHQQPLSRKTNI